MASWAGIRRKADDAIAAPAEPAALLVVRDGRKSVATTPQLVPGDIVKLHGTPCPDCKILGTKSGSTRPLTGESTKAYGQGMS